MRVIRYTFLSSLTQSAEEYGVVLFDSGVSHSFRLYDVKGNTTHFHVLYYR